jgi:hypothetical protein
MVFRLVSLCAEWLVLAPEQTSAGVRSCLALALSSQIAADLIRDAWRHLIYETSACLDGLYCFVRVRKATADLVCDDYQCAVFDFHKNLLDPLRYITSDANKDRVILQVVQSGDIVTLMLAYIDSPFLHARNHTRMYPMSS